VHELKAAGNETVVADLATDDGARGVDVLDLSQVSQAVTGADVVYHLAGPVLDTTRRDPFGSSSLQFDGTLNVLEACRLAKVTKIVLASSFYVYDGLPSQSIVNESSTLDPSKMELFGAIKLAAEQLVQSYSLKYGMTFVILRYGSAYGLGEGSNLVQTFFQAGRAGRALEVWGPGRRMNQYTYCGDIAKGSVLALTLDNEIVNLISPQETSTRELASLMHNKFGYEVELLTDKPEGGDFPYMSSRKAIRRLGWSPVAIEEGLDLLAAQIEAGRTTS
jgi:UDP-glucose 4-epimerase